MPSLHRQYLDPLSDRFRKSTEDLNQRKIEYRGPLLQKFHSGEFSSRSADVGLLGPSSHKVSVPTETG